MKAQFKSIVIIILASCFLFGAKAQINLLSMIYNSGRTIMQIKLPTIMEI